MRPLQSTQDIYAMNLPLFLPDLAGLHRVAVTYFARFRMTLWQSLALSSGQLFDLSRDMRGHAPNVPTCTTGCLALRELR